VGHHGDDEVQRGDDAGIVAGAGPAERTTQIVLVGDGVVHEATEGVRQLAHQTLERRTDGIPRVEELIDRAVRPRRDVGVDPGLVVALGRVVAGDQRRRHARQVGAQVVHRPVRTRRHDGRGAVVVEVGEQHPDAGAGGGVLVGVVGCGHGGILASAVALWRHRGGRPRHGMRATICLLSQAL